MKKNAEINIDRLCWAMQRARLSLRYPREERTHAVRQMVGLHWSEEGAKDRVPINMLSLYTGIVGRSLIAKDPRVLLSTFNQQHKPIVAAMESWANRRMVEMRLAATLQRVVLDGLFSVGICKVALATPADAAGFAWRLVAGTPFAERVDLDDFVFDIHARAFEEVGFIGHRYRVPLDAIRDSKIYSKARKDLTPTTDQPFNLEGDERISMLGRTYYSTDDEQFEDYVDLWEVYVPRHRLIYTLPEDYLVGASARSSGNKLEPLRVQRWVGPDSGPYHVLGFRTVPGNIMPKGPVQDLVDLHEFINQTYRKIMRQTARLKIMLGVGAGGTEDAARINNANDGEAVQIHNADQVKEFQTGGPNQQLVAVFVDAVQRFSYLAGNLDIMGGLSPQSKTATQDKMLQANSSETITDMQDRTVDFTASVIKAMCWYWHHDPFQVMKTVHTLPGMPEMASVRKIGPQMRQQVAFEDMDIRVDPYSMKQQTPQQRLAAMNQVIQTILLPLMPLAQGQGVSFDVNAYLVKVAKYLDQPDLPDIITLREPPQQAQAGGGGGEAPAMPQETTRNYVRENMPGRTQRGDDMNKVNALMGVRTGGAERNGQPMGAGT